MRLHWLVLLASTLVAASPLAAAEPPPYTLLEAEDWSEGDFYRVRFAVESEAAGDPTRAEAIARDLVERRVKRRVLHVADVRVYPPGADRSRPPAALVLWAAGGDASRRPVTAPGDYSAFRYSVHLASSAEAVARRLAAAAAPAEPARPTPVPLDLGEAPARAAFSPATGASSGEAEPALRAEILAVLARWRAAWEARDLEAFLDHYAAGFRSGSTDRAGWRAQKERAFARAGTIHLDFRDIEIAGEQDRATARFTQEYRSDALTDVGVKSLVLVRLGGEWKILREEWEPK